MSMPSFAKSPPELVDRFDAITAGLPGAERRQMFGYPSLFVGGNLVTGLHQANWFVRIAEADRVELLAMAGAGPFEPMPGRPMGGYVVLPASILADDDALRGWVDHAIEFGRSLPPKEPRASKPKASKPTRS